MVTLHRVLMGVLLLGNAVAFAGVDPPVRAVTAALVLAAGMGKRMNSDGTIPLDYRHLVVDTGARTVDDVLARRTRSLILNARAAAEAAPRVARILAGELGRDPAWANAQALAFQELAAGYALE